MIRICTSTDISKLSSSQTPAFVMETLANKPLMHFRVVGGQPRPRVVRLLAQGDRLFAGHLSGVNLFCSMAISVFLKKSSFNKTLKLVVSNRKKQWSSRFTIRGFEPHHCCWYTRWKWCQSTTSLINSPSLVLPRCFKWL